MRILLLAQVVGIVFSLKICTRRHYTVEHDAIFQRIDLPNGEKCVERCIENIEYCRAALFIDHKKKNLGFCIIHTVNSDTHKTAFHPDASLDPHSTVFELLEKCPPFSSSDMGHRISPAHRRLLESSSKFLLDKQTRADASFPERDRFNADEFKLEQNDRYAVMKSLDSEDDPRNPFDSSPSKETSRPKSPFEGKSSIEGLSPIQPVMVLHQGRRHNVPCRPGVPCVPTLHQLDSGPCPARQGDPCAPKPPCMERGCYHVDAPVLSAPVEWNEWSGCSVSCGIGLKTRSCGGSGCLGPSSLPCSNIPCPEWNPWGIWSLCSATCGTAERTRSRTCRGNDCPGASVMVDSCPVPACPSWSSWGEWQGCAVSCGMSTERRMRRCENGLFCPGSPFEDRTCDRGPCPHWDLWTEWTQCSSSCGGGEMMRSRACLDGASCPGASEERLMCSQQQCPDWTQWTQWTVCDEKCGEENFRLRNRICLYRGVPFAGCEGSAQDQMACPVRDCAAWTEWNDWTECSATCGQGNQMRIRRCEGGSDCVGSNSELRFCQLSSCPYWGEWTQWGGCSVSCGIGICERKRKCVTDELLNIPSDLGEFEDQPTASFESEKAKAALIARSKHIKMTRNQTGSAGTCDGPDVDRKQCDAGPCCMWDPWTEWSPCIGCGAAGLTKRSRQCQSEGGPRTNMPPLAFQEDAMRPGVSPYVTSQRGPSDFSLMGLTPIVPIVHRGKRHMAFQMDGPICHCPGDSSEMKSCPRPPPCREPLTPCQWSEWAQWCGCTKCRAGREVRRRYCDRPSATSVGPARPDPDCRCSGQDTEERNCKVAETCFAPAQSENNDRYIPIDSRINTVEFQVGGGRADKYTPNRKDSAFSTTPFPYPVCRWSRWSDWSECHETKQRQRNRFCIGSDALVSNCQCMGLSTEESGCDPNSEMEEKPRNVVPGVEGTEKTEAEFSAEDESEIESGLDSALKSSDVSSFPEEEPVSESPERNIESTADRKTLLLPTRSNEVEAPETCEWTRWSLWSDCTASCGPGEMLRKRRCPCGESRCGGGIESEISACEKTPCTERRLHPIFKIQ